MGSVAQNLAQLQAQIQAAASGRPVTLLAVSKTKPLPLLLEAFAAGQTQFGENRVQEALEKKPQMPAGAEFHLIGPLQKNKAKACPGLFGWVHSLDRLDVAQLLSQKAQEKGVRIKVLVQLNLSLEDSKSGITRFDQLAPFCESLLDLPGLELKGLMTIGHPNLDEGGNKKIFAQLRELLEKTRSTLGLQAQMDQLSMGMSWDWRWALEEGATILRIGSAIFGGR